MSRYWINYPATDLRIDPDKTIAILPTAAVEQHGPHLPVGVDTMINQGLCDLLAERCPPDLDIRLLPVMAVGKSNEHLYAPGTLTLTAETALRAWTEIGLSVARAGVRKMLIVNSHGGNTDLISIVARELRVQAGMYCVRMGWGAGGVPDGVYSAQEMAQGIHGGDNETSLMLHFRPDTVDMTKAQDFRWSNEQGDIPPVGAVAHGWIAADVNPAGVAGEAHLATAEKGRRTADHYVAHVITVLQKIAAQDISGFEPVSDAPTAR
ncbi:creatininase family protein [Cognatiyoonia sp. IB215446]|uniref:creatininase family protein n=1 Tax=Cognatiyoonia sp. IB215446 TaxID=3097355 RepID=UPI002A113732|nr:creatininase family protein [Cognatiyoonia sp. IB215446]MDX8347536.1 creatininase family protein [Cognatiyoonia sp. IB215446]